MKGKYAEFMYNNTVNFRNPKIISILLSFGAIECMILVVLP